MAAAKVRFELNSAGVRDLLRSAGAQEAVAGPARAIAARAGEGHSVDVRVGRNRARASVRTDTVDAMLREQIDRNLTRAAGGAAG